MTFTILGTKVGYSLFKLRFKDLFLLQHYCLHFLFQR